MPDNSVPSATLWSWLFPLTYIIHIGEEFYGGEGYPAYLKRLRGVEMSSTKFLVGQAIGLALIVVGILIARRLSHLVTSSYYREYGPGLISGVLIWIPFGLATLIRFRNSMRTSRYWLYLGIGVGINAAIAVITLKGGKG
jgi:hypothetical protein